MFWRAKQGDRPLEGTIHRFDPAYWTVNFAPPMMATIVTDGPAALLVRCVFYRHNDLAGLIWMSEDTIDHPLLRYETHRDYRGTALGFRWQSQGVAPLDAIWGPTLTIEGRDEAGQPRTWYVRLWNYAQGTGTDAQVYLDFDSLNGGFLLPEEADPVWAGDIDRMFISLVPPDYTPNDDSALAAPQEALIQLTDMRADGWAAPLAIGEVTLPPHRLAIATGFDDIYPLTPERVIRGFLHLGYRGPINLYVGMSHYPRLIPGPEGLKADPARPLNAAAELWFERFCSEALTWGFSEVIASVSFELLASYAPLDWAQRAHDGSMALTGWDPPSTLLSPTNSAAMTYLQAVLLRFGELQESAGIAVSVQLGEPWWWSGFGTDVAPCFYDAATLALYPIETGQMVPAFHQDRREIPDAAQSAYLVWLGEKLGQATLALRDAIKARWPSAPVALLFYTPQVLDQDAPMLALANLPEAWAAPAFDRLQLEDYDHVVAGQWHRRSEALQTALDRLGYVRSASDYFSGFVLTASASDQWRQIDAAADRALAEGFQRVFIWAQPQVDRDGYVRLDLPKAEESVSGFHDVRLPARISFGSTGGPEFSTLVVETASGAEQRNINWSDARARYDVAPGIGSPADLAELVAFFRARRGRAYGFRFKDWADCRSAADTQPVTPTDEVLGTGDGEQTQFDLVKRYGDAAGHLLRRITKPVAGTVRVALDGVEHATGWSIDLETGRVFFADPPAAGVLVTAGFEFDVPVRFAEDRLSVSLESFQAGAIASIPLVEIRIDTA